MAKKKPGKYAHLVDKYPKFVGTDPSRDEVLLQVTREIVAEPTEVETLEALVDPVDVEGDLESAITLVNELLRRIKRSTAGKKWAAEYVRAYSELRTVDDALDEMKSSCNLLLEVFEKLMTDQLEAEGTSSLKLDSGVQVITFPEPLPQVEDKEAFRQWCLKDPDLAPKMTLHPSTTSALVKEMLIRGEAEPPGVSVYIKTNVRLLGR